MNRAKVETLVTLACVAGAVALTFPVRTKSLVYAAVEALICNRIGHAQLEDKRVSETRWLHGCSRCKLVILETDLRMMDLSDFVSEFPSIMDLPDLQEWPTRNLPN